MRRLPIISSLVVVLGLGLFGGPRVHAEPVPLQQMLDRAAPGDTILLAGGVYNGSVVISKRLALLGSGEAVVRGDEQGSVITILADSCLVQGLIVERSGNNLMNDDSGIFVNARHVVVRDNTLRDILFGIYMFKADSNLVANNRIRGRSELEPGQRGSGIHIWNSYYNRFRGNTISEARDGFYVQYAKHTVIEDNTVFNLRYGLHYMYADSNEFLRNTFFQNVAGAAIMYSRNIVFRHNLFTRNRGFSSFGILFQDCHDMVADSNVISDNMVGLFFEATTDNVFRHNIIALNDAAVQMFQNSLNNTFTENNFVGNLTPLLLEGKSTQAQWSRAGRGNYWSSYDGYDMDGDAIGDTPMKIQNVFQYLEGQRPNLRLYLYSPASQALATAASAFPIIDVNSEVDEFPLMRPVDLGSLPAVQAITRIHNARLPSGGWQRMWLLMPVVGVCIAGMLYHHRVRKGA
ncbi:MAG: nitrous oxide reductase family maturation protein NosD [Ignavibacteria bacterium]|nr:nitrous oxide reductase family maturation protein NosD [Ignavibacteria bacterium]